MDANNRMVLLALTVYQIKNSKRQTQFLEILHSYFDNKSCQITFCTERQKGLFRAIETMWPTAYHNLCARYVYANF